MFFAKIGRKEYIVIPTGFAVHAGAAGSLRPVSYELLKGIGKTEVLGPERTPDEVMDAARARQCLAGYKDGA